MGTDTREKRNRGCNAVLGVWGVIGVMFAAMFGCLALSLGFRNARLIEENEALKGEIDRLKESRRMQTFVFDLDDLF